MSALSKVTRGYRGSWSPFFPFYPFSLPLFSSPPSFSLRFCLPSPSPFLLSPSPFSPLPSLFSHLPPPFSLESPAQIKEMSLSATFQSVLIAPGIHSVACPSLVKCPNLKYIIIKFNTRAKSFHSSQSLIPSNSWFSRDMFDRQSAKFQKRLRNHIRGDQMLMKDTIGHSVDWFMPINFQGGDNWFYLLLSLYEVKGQ